MVALTGSVLSVFPALDQASAKAALGIDVATLAGRVTARVPGVETLVRQPSGTIVAHHLVGEAQRASIIDPASGEALAAKGFEALREPGTVNRQSEPEFRHWCDWLGKSLGTRRSSERLMGWWRCC